MSSPNKKPLKRLTVKPGHMVDPSDDALRCPNCQEPYTLHLTGVTVFRRDKEDSTEGLFIHTPLEGTDCRTRTLSDKERKMNPSSRRSGVRLSVWCEQCQSDDYDLCLANHKGEVTINFQKRER